MVQKLSLVIIVVLLLGAFVLIRESSAIKTATDDSTARICGRQRCGSLLEGEKTCCACDDCQCKTCSCCSACCAS